jgi:hypothetical protein
MWRQTEILLAFLLKTSDNFLCKSYPDQRLDYLITLIEESSCLFSRPWIISIRTPAGIGAGFYPHWRGL